MLTVRIPFDITFGTVTVLDEVLKVKEADAAKELPELYCIFPFDPPAVPPVLLVILFVILLLTVTEFG
jgi:hypothetical protein